MGHHNSIEDFVIDPSFRKWVLYKDDAETAWWQHYLEKYPEKRKMIEEAKSLLQGLPNVNYQMPKKDLSTLWQQIEAELTVPEANVNTPQPTIQTHKTATLWYYLAASVAGFALFAVLWYLSDTSSMNIYQTGYGETKQLLLPDSSLITLNANSSLQYSPNAFNQGQRDVWVKGEAFFEVKHLHTSRGEAKKFVVHTQPLTVEVLGTQFNVNTRRSNTKVLLTEGKVKLKLKDEKEDIYMDPGDMVTFDQEQKTLNKKIVNPEIHTAWKRQELVFEDTPVSEILYVLEDTYGLQLRLENQELGKRRYTGTFKNPDAKIILTSLKTLFDLKIERDENIIVIK